MNIDKIKEQLLDLDYDEKVERVKVRRDYNYYNGKSKYKLDGLSESEKDIFKGQSWENDSKVDYKETKDIRNKVKPILRKRARFMFGVVPDIIVKAKNKEDRENCEELRQFLEEVLNNNFWRDTKLAFLDCSIKKRVLVRAEINENKPIKFKYEKIEDFSYKESNGIIQDVKFFEEDRGNVLVEEDEDKIYYVHRYFYKLENESSNIYFSTSTYKGSDLQNPINYKEQLTECDEIPCYLIKNNNELNSKFGESDVEELKDAQSAYNRTISNFYDSIMFSMFPAVTVVDGDPEDVNALKIAPGAMYAIGTSDEARSDGKQAIINKIEHALSCADAINSFLDRTYKDMKESLDIPDVDDLVNIPSAKAMRYLYNDLIIACEDKWTDWTPIFEKLINLIMTYGSSCYEDFKKEWNNLEYTITFKHNYPLPDDEEDKKATAINEVTANVRSRQSYIKKYSDEEDADAELNQIINETKRFTEAQDIYSGAGDDEGNYVTE